jgi:hypothetical protein
MQRTEDSQVILLCDFCRRDWDGQEAMIEGHHGSIICLSCLQRALAERGAAAAPYRCGLCLREDLPTTLLCYVAPGHAESVVCHDCIRQAAKAFARSPHTAWEWDGVA